MPDPQVEEPQTSPSVFEELLRRSHTFLEGAIADRVKASVERAIDWTFRRVITYVIAAALFATAAVFLLVAGTEGLKQAGAAPWIAYLVLGLFGALAGAYLLKTPPNR